jgi:catechol 2,3-dioxygenase-like lactoylglutathione lyase family enzyme
MLSNARIAAVVAVADLEKGRDFYSGTLGLAVDEEEPGGILYACGGGTRLLVYESGFAGTNEATAVSWEVDDLEGELSALRGKGIAFEQYDLPGVTREGDIHVMGSTRGAWFKDPDGNILSVVSRR